jgi:putative transposase
MRRLAYSLMDDYRISRHRACVVICFPESTMRYVKRTNDDTPLRERIRELVVSRVRYGSDRIHMLLRREGWIVNHKKVRRIYREEGFNLRLKRPRRSKSAMHRLDRPLLTTPNQCWSMDFVHDQLFDGRRFRALTIVDNFSRFCYGIHVAKTFTAIQVAEVLEALRVTQKVLPQRIQVDNGSEFTGKDFDRWAHQNSITLDYSRPGKPTDNPFIESFNGSFRDECLNLNWFLSLKDATDKINTWKNEYNHFRPHSSLKGRTPSEVIQHVLKSPKTLF